MHLFLYFLPVPNDITKIGVLLWNEEGHLGPR
jgi:hypothetical protein